MNSCCFKIKWIFLVLFLIALSGCTSIGPKVIPQDRYFYNISVENSNRCELLLNIVRLRYDESPFFLSVSNISAGYAAETNGHLGLLARFNQPVTEFNAARTYEVNASGGASYRENPIINYAPLEGEKYARQILQPLRMDSLSLVLQSGWNLTRVFRIAVECIGQVCNTPSAGRPTSTIAPLADHFIPVLNVFRDLQINNKLIVDFHEVDHKQQLILTLLNNARLTPAQQSLLKEANIKIYHHKVILTAHPSGHETYILTRSVLGMLNYISKGVVVPQLDMDKNLVVVTKYPDGRIFNWQKVLAGIIKIQTSNEKPDTNTVIHYRNRWYYIDDSDQESKKTLILLTLFLELLQAQPTKENQPVYTISQG